MPHLTFVALDVTTFCRLDELGLVAVGQLIDPDRAVIECRLAEPDPWCPTCGAEATPRDTVVRRLAHAPFGHRPTTLLVRVRRYRCGACGRVWRQDTTKAARAKAKLSRGGTRWALEGIVVDHLSVSRVAAGLGVGWRTANTAVLAEGKRQLIDKPDRFDGVCAIGVDEHVWRHTHNGDKFVTVIIDLTPVRRQTGPARLLDMVEGRSKQAFKTWLAARPKAWRDGVDVVAMDGFTGFKHAAVEVMDPFHVVQLAGDSLDECRRRVQQDTLGHRGRAGDPLFGARRMLHTRERLLTDRQKERWFRLFTPPEHCEVEATWGIYQRIAGAYDQPDPATGKKLMRAVIDTISQGVPEPLVEVRRLGRTLKRRTGDILAYFDRPHTSNRPTEAINSRLEHLRGVTLGFRNLTNYIARSLLESAGFRPALLHP